MDTFDLAHPCVRTTLRDPIERAQLALRLGVSEYLVPELGKGEQSKENVAKIAKAFEALSNVGTSQSLVLNSAREQFGIIGLVLQALTKPLTEDIVGTDGESSVKRIQACLKDTSREGYRFVVRKAIEQNEYWKSCCAAYFQHAVASYTLMPELNKLVASLEAAVSEESAQELSDALQQLPTFKGSLPQGYMPLQEAIVAKLERVVASKLDEEQVEKCIGPIIGAFLTLPETGDEHIQAQKARLRATAESLESKRVTRHALKVHAEVEKSIGLLSTAVKENGTRADMLAAVSDLAATLNVLSELPDASRALLVQNLAYFGKACSMELLSEPVGKEESHSVGTVLGLLSPLLPEVTFLRELLCARDACHELVAQLHSCNQHKTPEALFMSDRQNGKQVSLLIQKIEK
eukprot:6478245-Amphidinium_carterae.1